ncbi:MAG: hypothetical protein VX278_15195 [Myxococcota bacterium]|nr:hypothetical protein [Myxococcota bacterium]
MMFKMLSIFAFGFSTNAFAGGFEPKTMQDKFEPNTVDRWLVIGKGWMQFELSGDYKLAKGYWNAEGEAVDFQSTRWLYSSQHLRFTYGVTRYSELLWSIKTHYVNLSNDLGTNNSQYGFGDPEIGYKFELYRVMKPLTSVAVYARYKSPMSNESPGNYVAGPNTFTTFVFTTGTPDLSMGVQVKKGFGPIALTVDAGYMRRIAGLTLFSIETDRNQFMIRIKPGDVTHLDTQLDVQLGPVFLQTGGRFQHRQVLRIGTTAPGLDPNKYLEDYIGSDGWSLDARAALGVNIGHQVDLFATANIPIRGEDLDFWPLEELHPTYGNTYSAALRYRF